MLERRTYTIRGGFSQARNIIKNEMGGLRLDYDKERNGEISKEDYYLGAFNCGILYDGKSKITVMGKNVDSVVSRLKEGKVELTLVK